MLIGCHLSSSGGFMAMGKQASSIDANVFQFFTRNPRGGAAKEIDPKDASDFCDYMKEHQFGKILAHAPYTLNPCGKEERVRAFARLVMEDDFRRMEYVPHQLYNFHPGSHVGQGVEEGIRLISDLLNELLFPEMTTTVLLETMSGKGSEVGGRFEELRKIIDRTTLSDKLGVCLDTCHVHDAGYDIVNDLDGVLDEFDRVVGLSRLKAIHLNDSMNPFASHKDRHEKIGAGSLGLEAITRIICHPKLKDLPFYLETPQDVAGYGEEIAVLRRLQRENLP